MFGFKKTNIRRLGMIAAALILVAGCAIGGSHFKRLLSVSDSFEQYQLIPGYQYFISGSDYKPVAIVGLANGYTLSSPHWQAVQPDEAQLKAWIERMRLQPGAEYNVEPNGAEILDNQGNRIGVWYSVWETPLLRFKSEKEIYISMPMTVFPASNKNKGNDGDDIRPE